MGGDEAGGVDLAAVGRHQRLPQAGDGDGRGIGAAEQEGLPAARPLPPLVIGIHHEQAAAAADGVAEARFFRQCLGAGVDDQWKRLHILDKTRQESPAHESEVPQPVALQPNHRNRLRRRDIVARREIGLLDIAEEVAHRLGRQSKRVASAHGNTLSAKARETPGRQWIVIQGGARSQNQVSNRRF